MPFHILWLQLHKLVKSGFSWSNVAINCVSLGFGLWVEQTNTFKCETLTFRTLNDQSVNGQSGLQMNQRWEVITHQESNATASIRCLPIVWLFLQLPNSRDGQRECESGNKMFSLRCKKGPEARSNTTCGDDLQQSRTGFLRPQCCWLWSKRVKFKLQSESRG